MRKYRKWNIYWMVSQLISICWWLGLPPRPISTPDEKYIWYKARKCLISVEHKSIVALNCYKLEMKVWGQHVPVRFWFKKYNRPQYWCRMAGMHHLACQSTLPVCIWFYFCLCFDNWLTFNFDVSKYDYYTWISKWQNVNWEIQQMWMITRIS